MMTIPVLPFQLVRTNYSSGPIKFCIASNKEFIHINNFISHPPHPRRAVPANLPLGAFFLIGFSSSLFWIKEQSCPKLFDFHD
jgi:hypothetical protein